MLPNDRGYKKDAMFRLEEGKDSVSKESGNSQDLWFERSKELDESEAQGLRQELRNSPKEEDFLDIKQSRIHYIRGKPQMLPKNWPYKLLFDSEWSTFEVEDENR